MIQLPNRVLWLLLCLLAAMAGLLTTAHAQEVEPLVIAAEGATQAIVVVSPDAGEEPEPGLWERYLNNEVREQVYAANPVRRPWERQAATDLAKYIALMTGAAPQVADTPEAIAAAMQSQAPVFVVGEAALAAEPALQTTLDEVKKQDQVLRADAIVLKRAGNRVYLAGTTDDAHYYAVATLLRRWGCRWYMPTDFGEVVPNVDTLTLEQLDEAYAPPFEIRTYWLSWNASAEGYREFLRRNFMNQERVPSFHRIGHLVTDLVPVGKTHYQVPISAPATAEHVAAQVEQAFADGERFSLGMQDGVYQSDYERDAELRADIFDKYFMLPAMTEPFIVFYNNVASILLDRHPDSEAKIGFLAYTNLTIPPQREVIAAEPLVAYLAPIDIDPNHGMDSPLSPPRQEFREMMYRWARIMQGRLAIYDYDQGMLVWRDLPNPSHQAFVQDVRHYREAGILGVDTESRGAMATVFTNLYLRGQLMWNPDADVDALLADFYEHFYGPAAEPMADYWTAVFDAWENTLVTEHEFFAAPAIYTPALIETMRSHLERAEAEVAPLQEQASRSRLEQQYVDRMRFTRLSFDVTDHYIAMVRAAAADVDYAAAVRHGEQGLEVREALQAMNSTFVSTRLEQGWAWWTGEVEQYRELHAVTNGERGELVTELPLEWAFRRDPHDTGLASGFAYRDVDLGHWQEHGLDLAPQARKDYPTTQWEVVRSDLYTQPQGILHPDGQAFTGFMWYAADVDLDAAQAGGPIHVRFPGLFAECWLYVNGHLVSHREQNVMWWNNDYRYEWDVNLSGHFKPGRNTLVMRVAVEHHLGGMFRRPFLYAPMADAP